MNNKVAKKIRKAIYNKEKEEPTHDRGYTELFGGIIVVAGKRSLYKKAKKEYMHMKRLPSG